VIKGGKLKIVDGAVQINKTPGLGLEIDQDQLGKLHEQFLSCGIRSRDDVKQMQRYKPDWKTVKPRY
jgi:glucarate dehydratase